MMCLDLYVDVHVSMCITHFWDLFPFLGLCVQSRREDLIDSSSQHPVEGIPVGWRFQDSPPQKLALGQEPFFVQSSLQGFVV